MNKEESYNDKPCVVTNVCRGCLTYMTRVKHFGLEKDSQCSPAIDANDCPCTVCIIKGMCSKECESFIKFKQGG